MKVVVAAGFLFVALSITRAAPVLPNGDFEQGDATRPGMPAHWESIDGLVVQLTDAPAIPGAVPHGKAIRMDTSVTEIAAVDSYKKAGLTKWVFPNPANDNIAKTYGVSLYSEAVPLVAGKTYKVSFDYMSEAGTGGKLWFRAYANVNGTMKEVYRSMVDTSGSKTWKRYTGVFHPTKHTPNATEFKVMLFGLYPPGVCWFDNVDLEMEDEPADAQ